MRFPCSSALITSLVVARSSQTMAFQKAGILARGGRRSIFGMRPIVPSLFASNSMKEEVDPGVVEGTDLLVVKYPHPALRAQNAKVTEEDLKDGSMAQLAKEMFLLMYAADGVGLAAPQVGVNKRLMVYNQSGDSKRWLDEIVMVNPEIVEFSESKDMENEGCLSFPDMRGDVERSKWIKVEAMTLKGRSMKKKFNGWEARIFQHEYDHLDGVVYIDRMTEEGRGEAQPALDDMIRDFGEGGAI
jgi:peptide deformylase